MAKPHGIGVWSEERHAAGAFGTSLRFIVFVSQDADGLSQTNEKPDEKKTKKKIEPYRKG